MYHNCFALYAGPDWSFHTSLLMGGRPASIASITVGKLPIMSVRVSLRWVHIVIYILWDIISHR